MLFCFKFIEKNMRKILGLDLGTNSIGWALIKQDFEKEEVKKMVTTGSSYLENFSTAYSLVVNCLSDTNV